MTRLIVICAIFIACAIPAVAEEGRGLIVRPTAPTGEKVIGDQWLLTIGIDNYISFPRLKTATNDAKALKKVLLDRYHVDPSRIIELYDENATRKNILGALRDLTRKVKSEDSLLIFYAGHGHVDSITKRGSWIPVESGTDDPSSWISNQDIKDYLNIDAIKAKHVLLVSDSCFSGDFFRGTRGTISEVTDAVIKKAYQLSSRQAMTSGGLEPVSDAGFSGNSVFSHFLITALQNNRNPYLIPSELFPSIKSGVAQNAEQFPQLGSLYGVGGQDGGELVLFLKQEDRLRDLSVGSAARQKELELLEKAEAEASAAKQKEQAEISKKQAELDALDKRITDMKGRLGRGSAHSNDSLDTIVALVEQKEKQAQRLEELRQQREAEELKRQKEIENLPMETASKRIQQIHSDIAKYQKVATSKFGQDMKGVAWDALVSNYPEAMDVARYNVDEFSSLLGVPWQQPIFTDPLTGLIWAKNGNIAGKEKNWNEAVSWLKNLNYAGYADWRLPTKLELNALINSGGNHPSIYLNEHGFTNIKASFYWTSDAIYWASGNNEAWCIDMGSGTSRSLPMVNDLYIWPVRGH